MSRFFSQKYAGLIPYTPGEQPKARKYIKLNTNESPFPPSEKAVEMASVAAKSLQLYPDPECKTLTAYLAEKLGVSPEEILWTNGSDDILNFAFLAFCDADHPAVFPEITYGFYPVFAKACGVSYETIPLKDDFSVCAADYFGQNKTIFIANPNAPTGLALSVGEIEKIVQTNPDSVVVVDEAYVDFGAESCVPLIHRYDNLLVTQTFSKSRSMAGARLGFGVGNRELIRDLNTIKYSTNPYNINSMTMACGIGTLMDDAYTKQNCRIICETREAVSRELKRKGFQLTDSVANFIFASHPALSGAVLYQSLKEKGILVRHFSLPKIENYCRITVGSPAEMEVFLHEVSKILEENQ